MSVEADDSVPGAPVVTLTLDVVHSPRMANELAEHDPQALEGEAQHYHFLTHRVSVDAASFLAAVKASGNHLPGEQLQLLKMEKDLAELGGGVAWVPQAQLAFMSALALLQGVTEHSR